MNKEVFKHYQVGIVAMDSEHWGLLEGMDKVHSLVQQGLIKDAHVKIADLKMLLLEHFIHEEALMERVDFPFLAYHKEDHQKTLKALEAIYEKFPHTDYHRDCVEPVQQLMIKHVDVMDSQYIPYHRAWLAKNKPEGESFSC